MCVSRNFVLGIVPNCCKRTMTPDWRVFTLAVDASSWQWRYCSRLESLIES